MHLNLKIAMASIALSSVTPSPAPPSYRHRAADVRAAKATTPGARCETAP